MPSSCPRCQAVNRPEARFCDQCGTRLSNASPALASTRTELRLGTLLFCDLVGSTQLATRLDPDDLRLVFASLQRAVRQVAWRHGGFLVRFMGDGAFLVFGYPTAREDSALSAIEAGLDLVEAVQFIRTDDGEALQLRVGVASGHVVMGEMIGGVALGEQAVTGATAHLAARLNTAAPAGWVFACDQTRALVGQQVDWSSQGRLALKGFAEPQTVWRAAGLAAPMSRFDAVRQIGQRAELVGRDDALLELIERWAEAASGRGGGLLLTGDAGVGKSHLARAALQSVRDERALFLELAGSPRAQLTPLHPVAVALRRQAGIEPTDDPAIAGGKAELLLRALLPADQVADAAAELKGLFHAAGTAASGDSPELRRERMLALLQQVLLGLAKSRPLFLLAEDLHWCDPTTVVLLSRALEQAPEHKLLVLATARGQELPPTTRLPNTRTVELQPLGPVEARELVSRQSRNHQIPDTVVDSIVQRAEGVPLFLKELTQAAVTTVAELGDRPATDAVSERLPTTLHSVVQARVDRLPDLKPVLQAAAVMGREFHWPLLKRLFDDAAWAEQAVSRLVDAGMLVPTESASSARLRFKHALIHDAVYETLLRTDRQRLHSRLADLLSEGDGADALPEQQAYHLAEAARHADAALAWLEASRQTAARAAYQESIGHAREGLDALAKVTDAIRRRTPQLMLQAQLGVALTAVYGYAADEVERSYATASELCDEQTPIAELFPVLRGLGTYYLVRGHIDRADRLSQQCVALAHRTRQPELAIDAQSFAAYPAMYLGRLDESQRLCEQALSRYQAERGQRFTYPTPQDPATAALALLTTTAWMRGDLQCADQAAEELLAHVEQIGRPFDRAYGLIWLSASYQLHRRHGRALELAQTGLAVAQKHGLGTWIPAAVMEIQIAAGCLAPSAEAAATLAAVHAAFLQAGADISATFYQWGQARVSLVAGDRTAAKAFADAGLQRARKGPEVYMAGELLIVRAQAEDDAATARANLAEGLRHAVGQGAYAVALRAAAELALRTDCASPQALQSARDALVLLDGGPPSTQTEAATRRQLQQLLDGVEALRDEFQDTRWRVTG